MNRPVGCIGDPRSDGAWRVSVLTSRGLGFRVCIGLKKCNPNASNYPATIQRSTCNVNPCAL